MSKRIVISIALLTVVCNPAHSQDSRVNTNIGGGGLYYRHSSLQRQVLQPGIVCTSYWTWWGYSCAAGYVSTDQTLISSGSSAFGGNAGVGFTIKIADSGEKVYVESRYHYAPNKNIPTQLVLVTFGFRF
jgi:hypothetical protein